jgi:hypothetical protein
VLENIARPRTRRRRQDRPTQRPPGGARRCTQDDLIHDEVACHGVDQIAGVGRLADVDMVRIDRNRIAAVVGDGEARCGAKLFIEHLVADAPDLFRYQMLRSRSPALFLTRSRVDADGQAMRRSRSSTVAFGDPVCGDDALHGIAKRGFGQPIGAPAISRTQDLLHDRAAEAVTDEDERDTLQPRLAEQDAEALGYRETSAECHFGGVPIGRIGRQTKGCPTCLSRVGGAGENHQRGTKQCRPGWL